VGFGVAIVGGAATGVDADPYADVRAALADVRRRALVVVDTAPSAEETELIHEAHSVAVLTVIDPARRDVLAGAVEGHLASPHDDSDIVVGPPGDERTRRIVEWLERIRRTSTAAEEIRFTATDGMPLVGDLYRAARTEPGPAVVLMHSGRSDASVLSRLAELLARRGITALNLDWRGRGRSTAHGTMLELSDEHKAGHRLDVQAAFDTLAAVDLVDGSRLGALGIAHGAGHAASGALGDPRTKALVLLTGFHPASDEQRAALMSGEVDVLYITGTPHRVTTAAMRSLYEDSKGRRTRFVEYPEGVLGYQLFDLHRDLEPLIVDRFAEVLTP
jgi:dienelactone hydrolase